MSRKIVREAEKCVHDASPVLGRRPTIPLQPLAVTTGSADEDETARAATQILHRSRVHIQPTTTICPRAAADAAQSTPSPLAPQTRTPAAQAEPPADRPAPSSPGRGRSLRQHPLPDLVTHGPLPAAPIHPADFDRRAVPAPLPLRRCPSLQRTVWPVRHAPVWDRLCAKQETPLPPAGPASRTVRRATAFVLYAR